MLVFGLLLLLAGALPIVADDVDCGRVPPSLWCKNEELAKKCGVEDACKKFTDGSKGKKILLTLLYESLCPDCQEFITSSLFDSVYSKFSDYVKIELVPYGNAKKNDKGEITCQHGKDECFINKHEGCVIHYLHDPLPYIYCLEYKLRGKMDFDKASKSCFEKIGLKPHQYDLIHHCTQGKKGHELQLEAAERTENVWPEKHEFVPHLLFNNVSLLDAQVAIRDLPAAICDWIVGEKPDGCKGFGHPRD